MLQDIEFLFDIFSKFGWAGLALIAVLVSMLVNLRLFKKLFTNHLAHIHEDIKSTKLAVDNNTKQIELLDTKTDQLGERVAHIEGRIEGSEKSN